MRKRSGKRRGRRVEGRGPRAKRQEHSAERRDAIGAQPSALSPQPYHVPVLVEPVVSFLLNENARLIVDATLGGGGHTAALLAKGEAELRVIGIDADTEALAAAQTRLQNEAIRCQFVHGNFRSLTHLLGPLGITSVDGLLADLGVSSRQIDRPERGFSYMDDGPLDMRMNPDLPRTSRTATAAEVLATLEESELEHIFREYGEEKFAGRIARAIARRRLQTPFERTHDLRRVVEQVVKGPHQIKSLARIFQALRIVVNAELDALTEFLESALQVLRPGGRLAVISYHSLEDRIVKQFFKAREKGCTCPPEFPVCVCGKKSQLSILTKKPLEAGAAEIAANSRSRSARLRVAEKR